MAEGEPQSKKLKPDEDITQYFDNFLSERKNEHLIKNLRNIVSEMKTGGANLKMAFLRIKSSNAIFSQSFSQARLEVETFRMESGYLTLAPTAMFFLKGFAILQDFLDVANPTVPEDVINRRALRELLQFLEKDRDNPVFAESRSKRNYEKEWSVRFAQHLLIPLVPQKTFMLDSLYGEDLDLNMCCSSKHPVEGTVGDTSFGCLDGWHGHVDILITDKKIPLTVVQQQEDCEVRSVSSDSAVEVKREDFNLQALSQVMAETIVFSFLQQKLNGGRSSSSLVPGIGICPENLIVYLYDCVEDVLLESLPLPLFSENGVLKVSSVLLLWLVLNYGLFGNGIPDDFKRYKAEFHTVIGTKLLEMYRENVRKGCRVKPTENARHKPDFNYEDCVVDISEYLPDYVPEKKSIPVKKK